MFQERDGLRQDLREVEVGSKIRITLLHPDGIEQAEGTVVKVLKDEYVRARLSDEMHPLYFEAEADLKVREIVVAPHLYEVL